MIEVHPATTLWTGPLGVLFLEPPLDTDLSYPFRVFQRLDPVPEPGIAWMGPGQLVEQFRARELRALEAVVHVLLLEGASAELARELGRPLLLPVVGTASFAGPVEGGAGAAEDPTRPHGFRYSAHLDRPMMGWNGIKIVRPLLGVGRASPEAGSLTSDCPIDDDDGERRI